MREKVRVSVRVSVRVRVRVRVRVSANGQDEGPPLVLHPPQTIHGRRISSHRQQKLRGPPDDGLPYRSARSARSEEAWRRRN